MANEKQYDPVFIDDKTSELAANDPYVANLAKSAVQTALDIRSTLESNDISLTAQNKNGKEYDASIKVSVEPATKWNRETRESEPMTRKDGSQVYSVKASVNIDKNQTLEFAFKENTENATAQLSSVTAVSHSLNPKTFKTQHFHIPAYKISENTHLSDNLKAVVDCIVDNGYVDKLSLDADKLKSEGINAFYREAGVSEKTGNEFSSKIEVVATNESNLAYAAELSYFKIPETDKDGKPNERAGQLGPVVKVTALGEKASEGNVKYPDKGETLTIKNENDFLAIQDALPVEVQKAIIDFKGPNWDCAEMVNEDFAKSVEEKTKTKEKEAMEIGD